MTKDLQRTLADARTISVSILKHEYGKFRGLQHLESIKELDELDGYHEAIDLQGELLHFPAVAPNSMEGDVLCQMSIVFVMLDYLIKHIGEITANGVERT